MNNYEKERIVKLSKIIKYSVIFLFIYGCTVSVIGLIEFFNKANYEKNGIITVAKICKIDKDKHSQESDTDIFFEAGFIIASGDSIFINSYVDIDRQNYYVGERIQIIYLADYPNDAKVYPYSNSSFMIFYFISSFFISIVSVLIFFNLDNFVLFISRWIFRLGW